MNSNWYLLQLLTLALLLSFPDSATAVNLRQWSGHQCTGRIVSECSNVARNQCCAGAASHSGSCTNNCGVSVIHTRYTYIATTHQAPKNLCSAKKPLVLTLVAGPGDTLRPMVAFSFTHLKLEATTIAYGALEGPCHLIIGIMMEVELLIKV